MNDYKPKLQGLASIFVGKAACRRRFTLQNTSKSIKSCALPMRIGWPTMLRPPWRARHASPF
ncbi:hypothetical protein [Janthinobacterium sp. KBS0711]|uniref:hypothetical protein n=1 Tax=Janthinobacterium sp. KBS0711 TaxID=1649647 RepID=UPI001C8F5182|nr:hypothetical protein [Janthinobacterium sp. KBS0711]